MPVIVNTTDTFEQWRVKTNQIAANADGNIVRTDSNVAILQSNVISIGSNLTSVYGNISLIQSNLTSVYGNIARIDSNLTLVYANISRIDGNIATLQSNLTLVYANIGNLQQLRTTAKSNLVSSINETQTSANIVGGSVNNTTIGQTTANAASFTSVSVSSNVNLNNSDMKNIRIAHFNSQANLVATTGTIAIDWSAAQNYRQPEPTGTITYTFTNPAGPCHLQLLIDSDGTSTAQTFVWSSTSTVFLGSTWQGVNNKKAIINFWFDGSNYLAIGTNQV